MRTSWLVTLLIVPVLCCSILSSPLAAQGVEVVLSSIPGHPSSVVPGAVDSGGNPAVLLVEHMWIAHNSQDGSHWMVKGSGYVDSQLPNASFIIVGGDGATASVVAQGGVPVPGGAPGEVYKAGGFSPGGFDSAGRYVFTASSDGGSANSDFFIVKFDGLQHTVAVREGDSATGIVSGVSSPRAGPQLGNYMDMVHLLDDGRIGFRGLSLSNVATSMASALFYDLEAHVQQGVTAIGPTGALWSGDAYDFKTVPDGSHWALVGELVNGTSVLIVDDHIVVAEGDLLPGGGVITQVIRVDLSPNGSWVATGQSTGGEWAMADGAVVAQAGEPAIPGHAEQWVAIADATRTSDGRLAILGRTDALEPCDHLLVYDGVAVLRSCDAVLTDGAGLPVETLVCPQSGSLFVDDEYMYVRAITNSVGPTPWTHWAMLRVPYPEIYRGDCNGDGALNIADPINTLAFLFPTGMAEPLSCEDSCDANDDGTLNIADVVQSLTQLFGTGQSVLPIPAGCGQDLTPDALGCYAPSNCP